MQAKALPARAIAHILVVEDNDMLRIVTVKRLQVLGFSTAQASSGPEAVNYLESNPDVDLIFSDIVMDGGMSGYDVASWARKNRTDCPVLLTSGYRQKMDHESDSLAAELPVLQKPCSLETLDQAVNAILKNKNS